MEKHILHRERGDKETQPERAQETSPAEKYFFRLLISILVFVFLVLSTNIYVNSIPLCCSSPCSHAEQDAKNVLAALASYFSEPENMRVPTVKVLISHADLSLNNPVANVILFPSPGVLAQSQSISVMIIDDSERCPRNNAYIANMGGGIGYWK